MKTYLIVGGVAGGAGTAARLRRLDEQARIILFERGKYISYANCGLPYYAGGKITDRSRLFVVTDEQFRDLFQIEVMTEHEVTAINRDEHSISVTNLQNGKTKDWTYDKLVLSPGAAPIKLTLEGADDPAIFSLRSVDDVDAILAKLDEGKVSRATVIGGGFIGLEMVENLRERNLEVTLIEALDQVMNVLDYDMAAMVQQHLREKGVRLVLKDGVKTFTRQKEGLVQTLMSGEKITSDLVILSIGVRPDTSLAKAAGLELGRNGAIKVDHSFTTSDPDIKALGDAIEYRHPISGLQANIPLAGPANKQARLCADSLVYGDSRPYKGTIGTSIAKVFDLSAGSTGLTGKQLRHADIPYREVITHTGSHASYYPGALNISVKVLFDPETGILYGGQAVGYEGVDKRIDVLAAFIAKDGTIDDLAEFEQAYAPPFSSAKDPINMLGFIGHNVMNGLSNTITWQELDEWKKRGAFFLDVRTAEEFSLGAIEGAVNIEQISLRERLNELPKDRPIVVYCAVGLRGYLVERILRQNGFTDVANLSGGFKTWHLAHNELRGLSTPEMVAVTDFGSKHTSEDGRPRTFDNPSMHFLDATGLQCPGPILQLKRELDAMNPGDRLTVQASDPGFRHDVKAWCNLTGNPLLSLTSQDAIIEAVIEKSILTEESGAVMKTTSRSSASTLIVFSNDLDKALASFVLANGAAATGQEVTMFFTFWGLTVLRKKGARGVGKDFMGKMFGAMLPNGMNQLGLSQINFAGAGAAMMKNRMKRKNVDQLAVMFAQAKAAGVRFVACQMSMDIMGITVEELLDGVEVGGVATYMEAASQSGINLFI